MTDDQRAADHLGALLRRHRQRAGLTQQEVAARAGISLGGLRDLEQGRVSRPRSGTLDRLVAALGLPEPVAADLTLATRRRSRPPTGLDIRVLGPLRALVGDADVDPGSARQRALLGILALSANTPVPRDVLIEVLWGARPPDGAEQLLQTQVSRLRRRLRPARGRSAAADPLVSSPAGYQLNLAGERLDLLVFRRLRHQAREARDGGAAAEAFALYQRALALWRSDTLADVASLRTHPMVTSADRERRSAVMEHADLAAELGRNEEALPSLRGVVEADPLNEPAHARLMAALAASGQQAAALELFDRLRRRLADELGVLPGAQLSRAHRQIVRGDIDAPAAAGAVPAQLPPAVSAFVGREAQLARLDALLGATNRGQATSGTAVVISAVSGTAGVGKTALAVHWAHRARDRFPDGQLYVNLRGFDPTGPAVSPEQAIRDVLTTLAVPAPQIPTGPAAQAALYRTLLAERRMLVLLDNARDAAQVRPMLPGAPGCMVVVTSRNQLAGLVATEGAHPITLDLMSTAESRRLLAARIGAARVTAEPQAADDIAAHCAGLPLALAVVAARAATRPQLPLAALAAELSGRPTGLDAFDAGDAAADVRTVFSWSYRALGPAAARLFRLLGLHPGPDVALPAAASLAGVPIEDARSALAELARAHLVTEHRPGRYTTHDLLRAYAAELAGASDPEAERQAATRRMLDHYLHSADRADRRALPHGVRIGPPPVPVAGVIIEDPADLDEALGWFGAERPVLLAAVTHAHATGFDGHCWRLALTLMDFFNRHGQWQDWVATHRIALAAAGQVNDRAGQAYLHASIGRAHTQLGEIDAALDHLRQAFALFETLNDPEGQGRVQLAMSVAYGRQGNFDRALRHDHRALDLYRAAGHTTGQSYALSSLAWSSTQLGDHQRALDYSRQSLALLRDRGDRRGEAHTLDTIGYALHHLGQHTEAIAHHREAIDLLRRVQGGRHSEAVMLTNLGAALKAIGDRIGARAAWQSAVDILRDLGHPDADRVVDRLTRMNEDR